LSTSCGAGAAPPPSTTGVAPFSVERAMKTKIGKAERKEKFQREEVNLRFRFSFRMFGSREREDEFWDYFMKFFIFSSIYIYIYLGI
jgi:hypothetical protein